MRTKSSGREKTTQTRSSTTQRMGAIRASIGALSGSKEVRTLCQTHEERNVLPQSTSRRTSNSRYPLGLRPCSCETRRRETHGRSSMREILCGLALAFGLGSLVHNREEATGIRPRVVTDTEIPATRSGSTDELARGETQSNEYNVCQIVHRSSSMA